MTDMTGLIKEVKNVPQFFQSPIRYKVLDLNFGDPALSDMLATGTHNILTLAAGECIVFGRGIVHTTCVSTSNDGTVAFGTAEAHHAALTADGTELAAGDVFTFGEIDFDDTAGTACYRAAADTLDMTIATHAFTAGRIILIVGIVDIATIVS